MCVYISTAAFDSSLRQVHTRTGIYKLYMYVYLSVNMKSQSQCYLPCLCSMPRPAHCGAAKGQLETLRILGTHGANLWVRNVKGDYPLHEAVVSGRKDLVRWLLTQRSDAVNSPNNDGRCPLHIAAINNNVEMCKVQYSN
jgi:FOG: Ankyrin repeat